MGGFDWTPLGGEAFAATLTATERRIMEALDPSGGTVRYAAILAAVWPDRRHADPPNYRETQRIRAHRSRLIPKLAAIGWQLATREGYGIALRPVSDGGAEPTPEAPTVAAVRLGAREARWALRLAAFMAQRGETAHARGESARLENALRLALDGYESERRRRARAQNAATRERDPDTWRRHQVAATQRYREKHRDAVRAQQAEYARGYRERNRQRRAMTAPHRCPRCHSGSWCFEYEDKAVISVCMACGERRLIRDGRAEARAAELAAVRGLHQKHGPKPRAEGAGDE